MSPNYNLGRKNISINLNKIKVSISIFKNQPHCKSHVDMFFTFNIVIK